jgi:hypothetical protein
MKYFISSLLALLTFNFSVFSQAPFDIHLETINIPELGGLQSFAWGQSNGKWLIVGGRLDGLHRRQPFAAFDIAGHNNQIIVVDPITKQKWSAPLLSLPIGMQEQLSATNMEFQQTGDYLYVLGGYGYSNTLNDHITYPNLSAINVPGVIDAVINGTSFAAYFRQITDTLFAVTGGYLNKIYDTYYLTGGQKFMGRYNPMGPDHGPGFVQHYTNSIRKFNLFDDGEIISIMHLPAIVDETHLHRRDYNVVPQIMTNGQEGLTAFSGVFQKEIDLPYLNSVDIDSLGYFVNNSFAQHYNHYHCAHIPLFSEENKEMHTVFFGGIAQFYDSLGTLVQDNNVPFVNTIARITRAENGDMTEYKLPIVMPALLGAGSEFIPVENLPRFENEVLKLDAFTADTTHIGYIYGGISSSAANIFWTNDGSQSTASSQIFKVYLLKNVVVGVHEINHQSHGTLQLQVYPNPNNGYFSIQFNLKTSSDINISILDSTGKLIDKTTFNSMPAGETYYSKQIINMTNGGIYWVTVETPFEKATQKIIVE